MNDKRLLYRGFHPDSKNGKTTIVLYRDGHKGVIKGDWISGWADSFTAIDGVWILPETLGHWVAIDKNGNDVFEGDRLKLCTALRDVVTVEVFYSEEKRAYYLRNREGVTAPFTARSQDIELIGNKWECVE